MLKLRHAHRDCH